MDLLIEKKHLKIFARLSYLQVFTSEHFFFHLYLSYSFSVALLNSVSLPEIIPRPQLHSIFKYLDNENLYVSIKNDLVKTNKQQQNTKKLLQHIYI